MSYAPTQKLVTVKSSSTANPQSLRAPSVTRRHSKTVSTVRGRAWSDAEEAYLIERREHKIPYKHIACELKKTELACRLHYHQLSFGSKSRRQPSVSSMSSYERSSTPPPEKIPRETPQRRLPSFSPPASPETMDYSASEASQTPQGHKRILPKPVPSIHRRVNDPQKLCLVTEDMDRYQERQYIDIAKLNRLYDAHRLHFWSNIARSYGCNLSPATLEEAWCRSHGMSGLKFPPTPRGSPQISQASIRDFSGVPCSAVTDPSKGFMPINNGEDAKLKPMVPRQNPFAISSLLTDNKEVRQESTAGKEGYQMTVGA